MNGVVLSYSNCVHNLILVWRFQDIRLERALAELVYKYFVQFKRAILTEPILKHVI